MPATQTLVQTRLRHLVPSDLARRQVANCRRRIPGACDCRLSLRERAPVRGAKGDFGTCPAIGHGYLIALVAWLAIVAPAIAAPPMAGDATATELTLDGDVPDDWLQRLKATPNVRKLTIRRPDLKHFQVRQLKDARQLTAFRGEDFPLQSPLADAVAGNLTKLPGLESVTFERTGLTSRGLAWLEDSPITELVLKEEELLTDDAFEHVAKMKSLRGLVLDATPIEVAGFKHLQRCRQLRSLALRRHPAGSSDDGADARLAAIAGIDQLEALEIESANYTRLPVFAQIKTLRQLTLRRCGASEASPSLKQLKQLRKLVLDNCNIHHETFADVKASLAEIGIEVVDATPQVPADLLTRGSSPVNEATRLARQLHDELDVAKHHPSFWIRWRSDSFEVPSMKAEPVRSIYRLKQAISADHVRRPFSQELLMAWAPRQFYIRDETSEDGAVRWEQIKYGDARVAWARQRSPGDPPKHFIRNGIAEFVDALFDLPDQLSISRQSYWWGVGTHHDIATSSVSPRQAVYNELPAEEFAGESCRVLQSAGRSERLWISKQSGRLRGSLDYMHQGYFIPFEKQNIVNQVVGRRVASDDEYRALFGDGRDALPKEKQQLLHQAWAEYMFDSGIPGQLCVFSDYREIAPGRWFAFRVQSSGWLHNEQNQGRYDFHSNESHVTELALERDDLQKYWADVLPKKGEKVQDQRYGVPVEYEYDDDRTSDEIQSLVNEKLFDYARSALLIGERTAPIEAMVGKPAPPLPPAAKPWIGEPPDLNGKRYLIHCWAEWCGPCKNDVPLLNSLAKNTIVIGIHPSGTDMDQIRKAASETKMAYPTAVAPPGSKDMFGYPLALFPYCIEVDERGKVAKHGSLREVLGVDSAAASTADLPSNISGAVLGTEPDRGLVAISLGEADGLRKGQIFDASRDGRQVAVLRIVFVSKNRCVGKVVDENAKASVNKGDVVQPEFHDER